MGFFPERNGNARKIITVAVSRKKDRSDLTLFIPFLLVHDYLFGYPTSLEYYMQGFPGIFCYILGVKVTDLVPLIYIFEYAGETEAVHTYTVMSNISATYNCNLPSLL